MKSQTYLHILASQLLVGASSAWLFAWSQDEKAAVLPRETNAVKNHLDGRSPTPEPTSPPLALREPRRDTRLVKRVGDVCGYRNGNKALPLNCGNGLYCFNDPAISMIDCCGKANVQDCNAAVTCLDRTQSDLYTAGTNTWLCDDQEFPSCVTLRYGPGSYSGYTWIACGRTADDFGTAYYETTDLAFTSSVEPIVPPKPPTTVTFTVTPTPPPTPTTTSSTTSPPPTTKAPESSVPIGPIVGGAVGGVAVIALILFGIFFLVFKKRRQDPNVQPQQIQPQPVVSQIPPAQTPTPGPGPSSPGPGLAAAAANAGDIKGGGYFQSTYGGASPPMSPVPPYSSSPPPMHGAVSPMSMSAMTNSQFAAPSPSNGSQSPPPQMGLGVQGMQGSPQQQQQQYYQARTQQQPLQQNQPYAYQYGQAAELDTARGDGEVRELAG